MGVVMDSVSLKFRVAVKLGDAPVWRIAQRAGINPNVLSKILSGALRVKRGDPRVMKVATVVGLTPDECFEYLDDTKEG